jgi:hypothetical protein
MAFLVETPDWKIGIKSGGLTGAVFAFAPKSGKSPCEKSFSSDTGK